MQKQQIISSKYKMFDEIHKTTEQLSNIIGEPLKDPQLNIFIFVHQLKINPIQHSFTLADCGIIASILDFVLLRKT